MVVSSNVHALKVAHDRAHIVLCMMFITEIFFQWLYSFVIYKCHSLKLSKDSHLMHHAFNAIYHETKYTNNQVSFRKLSTDGIIYQVHLKAPKELRWAQIFHHARVNRKPIKWSLSWYVFTGWRNGNIYWYSFWWCLALPCYDRHRHRHTKTWGHWLKAQLGLSQCWKCQS